MLLYNNMSGNEQSIYSEYFSYIYKYTTEYGAKTIVLLQVGAFFEIYGIQQKDYGTPPFEY